MLALRRALLSSLLLVPFAACDDGSSDESDSGTDGSIIGDGDTDDDGGGDGDGDIIGDGDGDTQGDGDAGNGDGDSGPAAFSCSNAFTTIVAGEIISSDDELAGALFVDAQPANAQLRICTVPAASIPSEVTADHARGKVYFVEARGAGVGSALIALAPDAEFAASNATVAAPALTRVFVPGQAVVSATNAQFNLTKTGWLALSQLDHMGAFVYLRHLDGADKRYEVAFELPSEASYRTGESFDLGARVSVIGQPSTARTLAVVSQGCNLEPLQPLAEELGTNVADGCETDLVRRTGDQLDSDYADGALSEGRVFDLTTANAAATHLPPRFFCDFPGQAEATVNLGFLVGTEPELLVGASRGLSCVLSGDRISAVDGIRAETNGGGPIGFLRLDDDVDTLTKKSEAFVASEDASAKFTAVGTGIYRATGGALVSEQLFANTTLASDAFNNGVALAFDTGAYEEGEYSDTDLPLFGLTGEDDYTLTAAFPNDAELVVRVPHLVEGVKPRFGVADGASTSFSFEDGSVDLVVVRGLSEDDEVLYERWLRPSLLELDQGRRHASLFDIAEFNAAFGQQADAEADQFMRPVVDFTIEFLRVTWDKERAVSAQGRVLPLLAGYSVRVPSLASEPCPYQPDAEAECTKGRHHVLLVATANGIEMFDAVTGEYVKKVLSSEGANFKQVVQDPAGCLIASSQQEGGAAGIYMYDVSTAGVDGTASKILNAADLEEELAFLPSGLALLSNGSLLVANETGPALILGDGLAALSGDMAGYGISAMESQGFVVIADQSGEAGSHGLQVIPFDPEEPIVQVPLLLSSPEQVTFSSSSIGAQLGVSEAGARTVTLYAAGTGIPTELTSYTFPQGTGTPRGVSPLNAEGKWLVAGTDGLGVQVLDFTGDEPTATPVGNLGTAQAQYISSACVPF